jgi:uncharacterized membrane protein
MRFTLKEICLLLFVVCAIPIGEQMHSVPLTVMRFVGDLLCVFGCHFAIYLLLCLAGHDVLAKDEKR